MVTVLDRMLLTTVKSGSYAIVNIMHVVNKFMISSIHGLICEVMSPLLAQAKNGTTSLVLDWKGIHTEVGSQYSSNIYTHFLGNVYL